MNFNHAEVTETVIKAFYTVYNALGYGFLEKVYQNAMTIELRKLGLEAKPEVTANVHYDGKIVGEHFIDLLVADCIIVELKAVKILLAEHEAQLLNYLKATSYEVGLLLNFGPKPEVKRRAFDNSRKGSMQWLQKPSV